MEGLFLDMRRAHREEGGAAWRFWVGTVGDLATQGTAAWWERLRQAATGAAKTVREDGMSNGMRDVRTALRQFRRRPLHALAIVLLMAVGIGGNAAAFQVFHALFLDPLPFPEDDRLVDLDVTAPSWGLEYVHVAYPDFHAWRELNTTFESMALYDTGGGNMVGEGQPERVPILIVSHGMDDVLGISPVAGRFYTAEEDVAEGPAVGMISSGLWQRRFGNEPAAIGSSMTVNGFTFEIVGVLPPEAQYLSEADVWFPVQRDATSGECNYTYRAIGRLEEGVSLEAARAEVLTIHRNRLPGTPESEAATPVLDLVRERYLGRTVNGFTWRPDRGLALGASRTRLVKEMLTESALLGVAGASLGTVLGMWGSKRWRPAWTGSWLLERGRRLAWWSWVSWRASSLRPGGRHPSNQPRRLRPSLVHLGLLGPVAEERRLFLCPGGAPDRPSGCFVRRTCLIPPLVDRAGASRRSGTRIFALDRVAKASPIGPHMVSRRCLLATVDPICRIRPTTIPGWRSLSPTLKKRTRPSGLKQVRRAVGSLAPDVTVFEFSTMEAIFQGHVDPEGNRVGPGLPPAFGMDRTNQVENVPLAVQTPHVLVTPTVPPPRAPTWRRCRWLRWTRSGARPAR